MTDTEDKQLVRQCLEGDNKAFEKLIDKYQRPIFNAALKIVRDYEDARDVAQTVFVTAFNKLSSYKPEYKFFSWIYRMTLNEAINFNKRQKPRAELNPNMLSDTNTPEKIHDNKVLSNQVDQAVSELPLEYRLAIIFRHWADLPYRDISFILGIPEKTVKSRLYSARRLLAEIMVQKGLVTP